ncbi:MAG: response regulator transcription factor [Erysipelotrichaceae bacterium]|jgi:two-component system KDP operon response regulator KdpE|nr:response regulator transcription factor [Erysipelotrichaceae bacterium]MBR3167423.1 response regulator transcription factor [Erysipelotrichaceae bacterium]MCR5299789.1 response regulator transcription factor [Erysipelotrichaceae bacterium]
MPEFKILVVEDDRSIQNLITTALKINQYTYLNAYNGTEAISTCMSHNPDLILLDLGLPDIDGIEVIKTVRTWSNVPIVVISARDEDSDKIEALDSGADDYLTKPFSVQEMLARIRAVQRRQQYLPSPEQEKSVFENGRLKIDYAAGTAELDGNELHLTPIEYKILCLLSRNVGKVLTHSFIISNIWGNAVDTDIVSLRVYMTSLRKKLKCSEEEEPLIRTRVGIGYQMVRV